MFQEFDDLKTENMSQYIFHDGEREALALWPFIVLQILFCFSCFYGECAWRASLTQAHQAPPPMPCHHSDFFRVSTADFAPQITQIGQAH